MAEGTGTGTGTTGAATTGTVPPAQPPAVTPEVTTSTTVPITAEQLAAVKPVLQQQMLVDKAEASHAAAKLDQAADDGKLTLDVDAADALIKAVDAARDQVMDLWKRATDQLATPLQLGENPVAKAISARFSDLAVGEDSGAAKALLDLFKVLDDIGNALRRNRDTIRDADEEAEKSMKNAGGSW
ncbi:hypothetical protein SAMN04488074_106360 [Lentzea albidocapillata subsp. violacea]|uniref:Uncharacterized protein n=1 Tax=Lentzea albidocapillata subsp. violacea TaxID=128104 RepID=A0A1G9DRE1_9PSEU|nr:hypothetical protein [Lentzea albidocapillata]SDK66395.1 hypothetical protein SAMN04488074_106360 [Lentzea albidocapillata subsp. violacea]